MFFSRFFQRQNTHKQRTLTEKVDHIAEVVATLPDTLDKLHADRGAQLAHLSELPGIVLGLPTSQGVPAARMRGQWRIRKADLDAIFRKQPPPKNEHQP